MTKYNLMYLNTAQVETIAELARKHDNEVFHVYQNSSSKIVTVEFGFPYRYIVASNGRAIRDHV